MERYGCLYTKEVELDDSRPPSKYTTVDIKDSFFKNLSDCVRSTHSHAVDKEATRHYFKILKNSDIITHIHAGDVGNNNVYGYLFLYTKKNMNNEKIALFTQCNVLYRDLLDCITEEKGYESCGKEKDYEIKLAYFVLLNVDSFMRELQRPTV